MKKAVLYEKLKNGFVRCTCCHHRCMIAPGQSGTCAVRQNIDGDLYLRVYGRAVAVNIDPIEKKPFFHFLPGSRVFSFGTVGCNFKCSFCQNWDISQALENVRKQYASRDKSEIMIGKICAEGQDLSPKHIVDYCLEHDILTIAYTYNEPTIFAEYAADTAKLAKKHGIKNVFVSNGYESEECLKFMRGWCDAINIDIKAYSDKFYSQFCGAKLKNVLDTVKMAWAMGFWLECTTLVIPGLNDSDKELSDIAKYIAGISVEIPWHTTAFHPFYKMNDRDSTPASTLLRAHEIGKKAGLKFVYSGNIPGVDNEDTVCPKCGEVLIQRYGMSCLKNIIKVDKKGSGSCPKCNEKIYGIWK
ncbi:MAG: AmmeMemoRadiSam system radical SAM enzyme [Patescibacteria group bacterium]